MNPVLLQKQLRDNAADLEQFSKDLKNWGEEMKRKESSLQDNGNKQKPKVQRKEKRIQEVSREKMSKIGSTDYGAWEKFDADAECEKLEDDINDDSELSDEIDNKAQDEALLEKEKGNRFVKDKKWDEAIKCYSKAIKLYSYDPVFFANRALCYLKKEDYVNAEEDCTLSLKLDNSYVKVLQRRAAAREQINNLEGAMYDLENVMKLEPNNKESKVALENVRKKLRTTAKPVEQRPVSKFTASRSKLHQPSTSATTAPLPQAVKQKIIERTSASTKQVDTSSPINWPMLEEDISLVKAINKPPHLRSKRPLKRIEIKEVETNLTSDTNKLEVQAVKTHVVEKTLLKNDTEQKQDSITPECLSEVKSTSLFKKKSEKVKSDQTTSHETAWPKSNQSQVTFKSNDLKVLERTSEKEVKDPSDLTLSKEANDLDKSSAPKNSVQFYNAWKNQKCSSDRYKLLKSIEVSDIPDIFKESLETSVFSGILENVASEFIENKEPVYDVLMSFTKVKRFSAFTMFMDLNDKTSLWKIIDYIRKFENRTNQEVEELIQRYEL